MPEISVLMPIYNTNPKHLRQAIASILNQTWIDFEFLILNDTPKNIELDKIVRSFHDSRIRYVKSERNLGIAGAHNKLLDLATGRYIALMDHDDISLPERLERQYHYMEAHKDVGICGTAYKRFGKIFKIKTIRHPESHNQIKAGLLFYCPLHHPSALIRKSVLDRYHIRYDNSFISLNDRKLYLDISMHAQLHNLPDILYKYRVHPLMTSKIRRLEVMNEQLLYRKYLFERYDMRFSTEEKDILNAYIFNGRCRITSIDILRKIEAILEKLIQENNRIHWADKKAMRDICAKYLIRRCKNAALKGFVSSREILERTSLPVCVPFWLKIFNRIRRAE